MHGSGRQNFPWPVAWLALGLLLLGCGERKSNGPPSVVLVSLDTLRVDRVGAYGGPHGLTPNLDRFAEQAVVFENAYSQAPETLFSHASLFTSRYPSELGPLDYGFRLTEGVPTLASVLSAYGLSTGAFVGGGHLSRPFRLDQGFQTYENTTNWGTLFHSVPPSLDWLAAQEGPSLLFVHGYDTHARYLKPAPFGLGESEGGARPEVGWAAVRDLDGTERMVDGRYHDKWHLPQILNFKAGRIRDGDGSGRVNPRVATQGHAYGPEDVALVRGVYDGAVAWADAWFGILMAGLEAQGVLDRTIVVVLSDHGEELGEDGLFEHRFSLEDVVTHVPLMVRLPKGRRGGTRIAEPVGLIDLLPTLTDAVGAQPPARVRGVSLWPAIQGEAAVLPRPGVVTEGVFRMLSIRTPDGRLTFSGISADSPYLPDLMKMSAMDGPAWSRSEGMDDARALEARDYLQRWRAKVVPMRTKREQAIPNPLRKALQERGYWGPG